MKAEDFVKFFKADQFVEYAGIEIVSVDETKAVVGARVLPHHLNANGVLQGGMLFTLADAAFAVIANFLHPTTVSQTGNITYIAPGDTDYVTAEATELVRIRHNCVCQIIIKDSNGKIIATATMNGFIKTA